MRQSKQSAPERGFAFHIKIALAINVVIFFILAVITTSSGGKLANSLGYLFFISMPINAGAALFCAAQGNKDGARAWSIVGAIVTILSFTGCMQSFMR